MGEVVVEGEHNMMADTKEHTKEHSLHHMDSLGKRRKNIQIIGLLVDLQINSEKSKDWHQIGSLLE